MFGQNLQTVTAEDLNVLQVVDPCTLVTDLSKNGTRQSIIIIIIIGIIIINAVMMI